MWKAHVVVGSVRSIFSFPRQQIGELVPIEGTAIRTLLGQSALCVDATQNCRFSVSSLLLSSRRSDLFVEGNYGLLPIKILRFRDAFSVFHSRHVVQVVDGSYQKKRASFEL